ncbi:hypothetical protein [Nocardia seriolae]|uniref:Uncharacterized protein n=1 Tax=Nocardia seriolae TaxID=37332 RepID=A0ABC9YZH2_9NOCA|nr:hypothetical protein [Nocardia seriolae]APA98693.1 hypothetical protein NS506_04645 [Nocardia seriolae]OJF80677.1 hypothetical protein NS14008_17485 [Nocardia seriolae]WKY55727.1 hypothetical protein Q5P07_17945 [Nocardia seriolae]WNJ62682.1 hypothetical protein RMO66_19460 [Nocardia seriolae]BAW07281.1 conserved hypothetical protein [Nocardia seriolae]
MQEWVCRDLTGPGANWIAVVLIIYILVPLVYFMIALDYVYRRFRPIDHGSDPGLVARTRHGAQQEREEYRHE